MTGIPENVRINGYATDKEKFGNGISCVAAPVYDYTGTVIDVIGCSAFTLNKGYDETIKELLPNVLAAAKEISTCLGGRMIP